MHSLRLSAHLQNAVLMGHPWLYRDQLPAGFAPNTACWIELVLDKLRAYALYDPDSALALRVYSREQHPDQNWVVERVREAWELRKQWRDDEQTNAYRLINGEGDQLPGIVVDVYSGIAVISLAAQACELLLPWLQEALVQVISPKAIALRNSARKGDAPLDLVALRGSVPDEPVVVKENGLSFRADLHHGQKTGLFLDQRENRALVERHAKGRRVLNLFSYSGAFSLYAVRGGAKHVTSVDSAAPALEDARHNFRLNGYDPTAHAFETRDVFEYLEACRTSRQTFDFVICDPPSFGSRKVGVEKALGAYTRLLAAAIKVTEPSAWFAASSCTARVTAPDLTRALAEAARKARKQVQIVADRSHAPDHPIAVGHPEGRYLKFLLGRVSTRC